MKKNKVMKPNEAPEKIYFDGESKACKLPVFSSCNIEYTRTDAFIKKVCDFIRINAYKYRKIKFVKNKPTFDFHTDWLIEDLRKLY